MPFIHRDDATIYFEEYGSGFPIFLLAPGSLNSTIEAWHLYSPWDPTVDLAADYRVIAMDQRNAGRSRAPIRETDDWNTYLADQLALVDHLQIERMHLMGACIGVPFALNLLRARPHLVSAAVMQQPSGAVVQRTVSGGFDRWRDQLTDHPEATPDVLQRFRDNLYRRAFVYSVDREFVRTCKTPMVILPGNDQAHPYEIAKELSELAPNAEFIREWQEGVALESAVARIREFLRTNTPVASR
jgi:pimeloyl-ACP methyl ester carboxylesterase